MVATLLIYIITVLILTVVADKDAADIQASSEARQSHSKMLDAGTKVSSI